MERFIPDPGAVVFVVIAFGVFAALYAMVTDKRQFNENEDDQFAPRQPVDPEVDARRRQI